MSSSEYKYFLIKPGSFNGAKDVTNIDEKQEKTEEVYFITELSFHCK